ncbi:hypothetical protein BD311DRAFT_675229 [Dichomitus squalens]|uniref:Integrase catalytic domain-containing protein n=1 Tax=Dichomitus squalens TaxID=114155 RepID=A0A4Q9M7B8_9APHY|nr:hypothetical protein BD311DRAFT_675229 [Dichomitus squalens]
MHRHIPNPHGNNQYRHCPPKDDPKVEAALWDYHRRNISDKEKIRKLLFAEHGIKMSTATITRRRKAIGIKGSGATTRELTETEKRQLILDQMEKHPTRGMGPRRMQEAIAADAGVQLTRDYIAEEMHRLDLEGFTLQHPTSKKKHRAALVCLGPDYEISCDGHDKLSSIRFPIYGARDVWSGKWHGLWVLPNNRYKLAIAYVYLHLVKKLKGMPLQVTTDRGSETGGIYAFANALREEFAADYPVLKLPPHRFLPSIHNTTIERGWLRLRLQWGDDVKVFWEAGQDLYDEMDPDQYELVQWLWPKLIQQELDKLCTSLNNHKPRRVAGKLIPTGVAPNIAYTMPESYGGQPGGLQPVDIKLIDELMEDLGGEDLIWFVSREYEAHAEQVYASLGVGELTFHNVWDVFTRMLPAMTQ